MERLMSSLSQVLNVIFLLNAARSRTALRELVIILGHLQRQLFHYFSVLVPLL